MNDQNTLLLTPSAHKAIKRLSPPIRKNLFEKTQILASNPHKGEMLHSPMQKFRSLHITIGSSQYRVLYRYIPERNQIIIVYAATRENFYKEATRLNLKGVA